MKLIKFTIFLLVLSFIASTGIESQVKTKRTSLSRPPAFLVEFNFSYNQPLPQLMGDMTEQFSFKNYGVKYGVGSAAYFKLVTDKKGRIRPYFTFGYDLFLNTDNNNAYLKNNITTEWPVKDSTGVVGAVPGKSKMYFHNFHASLGFEYAFVNKTRWTPYANFDFGMNIMFGTYKQTPNSSGDEVEFTYKSATRLGLGLGFGVNGRFTKSFGIAIGIKYKLPNLLLKDSKYSNEVNKFYINDKEDTGLNAGLNKDRNMMYLQFYLGAAFYIGKK